MKNQVSHRDQVILEQMRKGMGRVPTAIEQAARIDHGLLEDHMRMRAYSMPAEGALDEQTRTLVYLAAALAGTSKVCIEAMADKTVQQGISHNKVLETLHIVRYAMATKMIGDAGYVYTVLANHAAES